MSIELAGIAEWIYGRLSADSSLTALVGTNIYHEVAPQGATYPMVRFDLQSTLDVRGATEATRIMVDDLWLIRAIDQTASYQGNLLTIANRIDALFHNVSGSVSTVSVFSSARENAMQLTEEDQGLNYRHLGGIYRIYAQGVS